MGHLWDIYGTSPTLPWVFYYGDKGLLLGLLPFP